jgi:hypothetical protein
MAVCGCSVLLFIGFYIYYSYYSQTKSLLESSERSVVFISSRLSTALQFGASSFALEKLETFESDGGDVTICVFDGKGSVFASFPKGALCEPLKTQWNGLFEEGTLNNHQEIRITRNIFSNKQIVGAVVYSHSKEQLYYLLQEQAEMMGLVGIVCLILCYIGINRLQRIISNPIVKLSESANNIVNSNTLLGQLHTPSTDELGKIVESFNRVLVVMDQRHQALLSKYESTGIAYHNALGKISEFSEDFTELMETFMAYQKITYEEMMGNDVERYQNYRKDVFDSLCFYHVKMDSFKKLTDVYAESIASPRTEVLLQNYITKFTKNLGDIIPFISIECDARSLQKIPILLVHKKAWDELFTLIRNLYNLLSGVVTFSGKIKFSIPDGASFLMISFMDQETSRSKKEFFPISDRVSEEDGEAVTYTPNSIEDPNAATEFLDDEILHRQDLKYIIDSITYIANANMIAVSHRFIERRFTIELDLSNAYADNVQMEEKLALN